MTSNVNYFANLARKYGSSKDCHSEDDDWPARAMEALNKKMSKDKKSLDDIEQVLGNCDVQKNCVMVSKIGDGRLQVNGDKLLPQVLACKIWRWPDIKSHLKLRNIESCRHPYTPKVKEICINPFHYQRIDSPAPSSNPVAVSQSEDNSNRIRCNEINSSYHQNPTYPQRPSFLNLPHNNLTTPINNHQITHQNVSPNYHYQFILQIHPTFTQQQLFGGQMNHSSCMSVNNLQTSPRNISPESQFHFENVKDIINISPKYLSGNLVEYKNEQTNYLNTPEEWATILYYEKNCRVGELFTAKTSVVVVDGYMDTSLSRFCLGCLSSLNRSQDVEEARRRVGKGLECTFECDEVFVECLSESPIFVRSRLMNHLNKHNPETIIKLVKGMKTRIFSNQYFIELLKEHIQYGYEAVNNLVKMCHISISFAKGWGSNYHFKDVTNTPCWIEVTLKWPLIKLHKILTYLVPSDPISSMS